jgi:Tol biopolymer transport system component
MVVPASGAGNPRVIFEDPDLLLRPSGVTPDDRFLFLHGLLGDRESNIHQFDLVEKGPPTEIIDQPRSQMGCAASPDGRWIAYSSDESGLFENFVEPYSAEASATLRTGRWQVSDIAGSVPRWSADGKTLYSLSFDGRLIAVDIEFTEDGIRIADSRTVARTTASTANTSFDIVPGTDRLLVINRSAQARTPITVVSGLEQLLRQSE